MARNRLRWCTAAYRGDSMAVKTKTKSVLKKAVPARNRRAPAKAPHACVRMYRQGLGDCFLLTLPGKDERPFHMLIDCGVVLGTPNPEARMQPVVQDIASTTGNHVDLLVA